jgi:plastocyanin
MTVFIRPSGFMPASVSVHPGDVVTWVNQDAQPHAVADDASGGECSPGIGPGGVYERPFPARGTYPYHCLVRPDLKGVVNVGS